MSFEVTGTLHKKYDTENKSGSFQAREFVIEIQSGNYPQMVKFQLVQDKCALLDKFEEGDQLKVYFDLRGREWSGKYFTNLNAWRVDKMNAEEPVTSTSTNAMAAQPAPFPTVKDEPTAMPGFEDDLPF